MGMCFLMEQPNSTSGLGIIRIEGTATIPAGQEVKVLDTVISDNLKRDEIFQHWRGQVINNSLFVEERLDWTINKILPKDSPYKIINLSFKKKSVLLRELLSTIESFKAEDFFQLFNDLDKVINVRNKFAHGQVSYSGMQGEKIFLTSFKEISKKEEVTENTIIAFIEICAKCRQELDKIMQLAQT